MVFYAGRHSKMFYFNSILIKRYDLENKIKLKIL